MIGLRARPTWSGPVGLALVCSTTTDVSRSASRPASSSAAASASRKYASLGWKFRYGPAVSARAT